MMGTFMTSFMPLLEWWEGFWSTYNTVVFSIGVNAMLALSIYLTLSCGLLSLANAAFMGIGAYAASLITMHTGLPFGLALLLAGLLPALVALIIGIPTLRLSGVYLAMATLGFGEVVRVIILNLEFTGGPMGINGIPQKTEFWHILLLLGATLYVLARLRRSKVGRAFEAIKEDEIAARLMGIDVASHKLLAFVLGAVIAGVAGGLNAHYTFTIGPGNYAFENAVDILTMAVFGGTSNLIGPTIGATILTLLPEVLRNFKDFRLAVNGLILVLVILYLPKGIWDPRRIRAFWQRRRLAHAVPRTGGSDA
jgi:branched-chain amino acid transport system permease protein